MKRSNIIGLMGNAKAGKSTSAKFMVEHSLGKELAFADKLKEIVTEMFQLGPYDCYDDTLKEAPTRYPCLICPRCKSLKVESTKISGSDTGSCLLCGSVGELGVFKGFWTPRMMLQHIGTDGFRAVSPKVWAVYGIRRARAAIEGEGARFVVFSDVRFRSECEAIWEAGGEVWRIKRPSADGKVGMTGHVSEVEQASIADSDVQLIIHNDATLDTLRGKVTAQLQQFLTNRALAASA